MVLLAIWAVDTVLNFKKSVATEKRVLTERGTGGDWYAIATYTVPAGRGASSAVKYANGAIGRRIGLAGARGLAARGVGRGWRLGDDVYASTARGNAPSWSTVRSRFWKNEAAAEGATQR